MKALLEVMSELQKLDGHCSEWIAQLESLFHLLLEGLTSLKTKGFDKFKSNTCFSCGKLFRNSFGSFEDFHSFQACANYDDYDDNRKKCLFSSCYFGPCYFVYVIVKVLFLTKSALFGCRFFGKM